MPQLAAGIGDTNRTITDADTCLPPPCAAPSSRQRYPSRRKSLRGCAQATGCRNCTPPHAARVTGLQSARAMDRTHVRRGPRPGLSRSFIPKMYLLRPDFLRLWSPLRQEVADSGRFSQHRPAQPRPGHTCRRNETKVSTAPPALPHALFSKGEKAFNSGQNSKRSCGLQEYLGAFSPTFSWHPGPRGQTIYLEAFRPWLSLSAS